MFTYNHMEASYHAYGCLSVVNNKNLYLFFDHIGWFIAICTVTSDNYRQVLNIGIRF